MFCKKCGSQIADSKKFCGSILTAIGIIVLANLIYKIIHF